MRFIFTLQKMTETVTEDVLYLAKKLSPERRNDTMFAGKVKEVDYYEGNQARLS